MYENLFENNKYLKLNAKELVDILIKADKAYHDEGNTIMTDNHYDLIKKRLQEKAPKNAYFKRVGFKPPDKLKVKLPYYLGSQDKIKFENEKELNNWFSKYKDPDEYYISEKLDGISCLIVSDKDNNIKIYTRGDGNHGIDITIIKDYVNFIPGTLPKNFAVRGELLLSKSNWEKVKDKGVNPRNLVAGLINRKQIDEKVLKLVDFVVYDYLSERIEISKAMKKMASLGFKIAMNKTIKHKMDNKELLEELKAFKEKSEYEIDGIVITHNKKHQLKANENPKYSFAFKSNLLLDEAEVIVKDVEWNVSKYKYLKPIIKFNPIIINGVSIKQTTGFNADFIVKNVIGKGSIIKIQRSGDVIPHIIAVLKESDNKEPLMPSFPYKWTKTKIDIMLVEETKNREQDIKAFSFFMKSLNIKGVSEGIIKKLYDNSYDSLLKIINITKDEVLTIDGFKEKSATNLITALREIKNKTCSEIMIASNILGRGLGEKKLELILNHYPFICMNKKKALEITVEDLMKVNGMGEITSKQFIENLMKFYDFYEELGMKLEKEQKEEPKEKPKTINEKIKDNHFTFSGFRNKDFENYIKLNEGFIDNTITSKTNYLIVKDPAKTTNKIENAIKKGVKLISIEQFQKMMK